jgi:Condensation domain
MRDQILVPFEGPGAGVEDLSWAQLSMWRSIQLEGRSITLGDVAPLVAGRTVQDMVLRLRFMLSRHESLRTRLRFEEDGTIRQEVSASGVIPLEVVEAGEQDPEQVAITVRDGYQERDFDYVNEWPVRMAVITKSGVPSHVVVIYLHLCIDALGLRALLADLATMDPVSGEGPPREPAMSPLEQARWQRGPAARRQSDASLRHLERVLRSAPIDRFPGPVAEHEPSYPELRFRSPAIQHAVRMISKRLGVDSSPILLALFAIALTRQTGSNPFVALLAVSNRFRPGLGASVSTLAQVSPCMIDLAGLTFDEAIGQARSAAVAAYKYAYYDPAERAALRDRLAEERGAKVDLSCFFSDRRQRREPETLALPTAEQLRAALPLSEHRWVPVVEPLEEKLYLSVDEDPDAILFTLSADTRYLAEPDMLALATGIEDAAVQAALDPASLTGIASLSVVM